MIARYAAVENLYLHQDSLVYKDFHGKLINLYACILKFLATCVSYFKQHTSSKWEQILDTVERVY